MLSLFRALQQIIFSIPLSLDLPFSWCFHIQPHVTTMLLFLLQTPVISGQDRSPFATTASPDIAQRRFQRPGVLHTPIGKTQIHCSPWHWPGTTPKASQEYTQRCNSPWEQPNTGTTPLQPCLPCAPPCRSSARPRRAPRAHLPEPAVLPGRSEPAALPCRSPRAQTKKRRVPSEVRPESRRPVTAEPGTAEPRRSARPGSTARPAPPSRPHRAPPAAPPGATAAGSGPAPHVRRRERRRACSVPGGFPGSAVGP